jgi:hypothetical protein
MSTPRAPGAPPPSRNVSPAPDPAGQSPDAPIEFTKGDDVARGNAERANAEPEPAALHDAEVPGKPDAAAERRDDAPKHTDN